MEVMRPLMRGQIHRYQTNITKRSYRVNLTKKSFTGELFAHIFLLNYIVNVLSQTKDNDGIAERS